MAQTASRKRSQRVSNSAESDQETQTKKPNSRSRRASPRSTKAKQMTKARDNEVQKVVKAAKQSRKSTSDAIAKIHAKANELLLLIEEENEQSRDGAEDDFGESLAAHCAMHSHDPISGCEAYEEAKAALQKFRALVSRYESTNDEAVEVAEPSWLRWKQDVLDLTAVNSRAKAIALQILDGRLAPSGWQGLAELPSSSEDQELSEIAIEMLDDAVPDGAVTWGGAAANIVTGYANMLKDTF